jgi:vancomycin permeability regulator SanA
MFLLIFVPLLALAFILIFFLIIQIRTRKDIYPLSSIPFGKYSLVLGAGLQNNGSPSDILADRVETAIKLLIVKKTEFLFLSGSGHTQISCEPIAMRVHAKTFGISKDQLIMDYKGISTFHSCVNIAKFAENSKVIIVTQMFHLPRALWVAQCIGIRAIGTPANQYKFSKMKTAYWYLREIIAMPFNLLKITIHRVKKKAKQHKTWN